jgi:hypothetical protein
MSTFMLIFSFHNGKTTLYDNLCDPCVNKTVLQRTQKMMCLFLDNHYDFFVCVPNPNFPKVHRDVRQPTQVLMSKRVSNASANVTATLRSWEFNCTPLELSLMVVQNKHRLGYHFASQFRKTARYLLAFLCFLSANILKNANLCISRVNKRSAIVSNCHTPVFEMSNPKDVAKLLMTLTFRTLATFTTRTF